MVPLIIGAGIVASSFIKSLMQKAASGQATAAELQALQQGLSEIKNAGNQGLMAQQPYMQHAGEDFDRQRQLVQSGYFQTPYNQSFTPNQNKPQGFSFNPSQGGASFTPQKSAGLMGYTPQGLPPMPTLNPYQAPKLTQPLGDPGANGGINGGTPGANGDPSGGLMGPYMNKIGDLYSSLKKSTYDSITDPAHALFNTGRNIRDMVSNATTGPIHTGLDAARNTGHTSLDAFRNAIHTGADVTRGTGHTLMDLARDPLHPMKAVHDAIDAANGLGTNIGNTVMDAGKDTYNTVKNTVTNTLDNVSDSVRDPIHTIVSVPRDVGHTLGNTARNARSVVRKIKDLF